MKNLTYVTLLLCLLTSCTSFKETVGLVKDQPDEYQVVSNPPLYIPPDFNVYSPEEIEEQKNKKSKKVQGNFSKGENYILENMNK